MRTYFVVAAWVLEWRGVGSAECAVEVLCSQLAANQRPGDSEMTTIHVKKRGRHEQAGWMEF